MKKEVVKANALINAGYRLSLSEQQLILAGIAGVNSFNSELSSGVFYRVYAKDLEIFMDIRHSYLTLKNAVNSLWEREFTVMVNKDGKTVPERNRWIQSIRYLDGEGAVELKFSDGVIPFLSSLTKNFTKYELPDVKGFSSTHSIRIFEWMMKWRIVGEFKLSVSEIKFMLSIEDKYKLFSDFRKYVLEVAQREINTYTKYELNLEFLKKGRVVDSIKFSFKASETTSSSNQINNETKPIISKRAQEMIDEANRLKKSI